MRGSQIYTRGSCPLERLLAKKFAYSKSALGPIYMCVKFQLSISNSFRDMRGDPNLH